MIFTFCKCIINVGQLFLINFSLLLAEFRQLQLCGILVFVENNIFLKLTLLNNPYFVYIKKIELYKKNIFSWFLAFFLSVQFQSFSYCCDDVTSVGNKSKRQDKRIKKMPTVFNNKTGEKTRKNSRKTKNE